jgi:hypothetical protein
MEEREGIGLEVDFHIHSQGRKQQVSVVRVTGDEALTQDPGLWLTKSKSPHLTDASRCCVRYRTKSTFMGLSGTRLQLV